jgi:hypothetical protein
MAYIINRYNGTVLTVVEDGTINTTTELKFVGKNYAGYGEAQNENFLFLLENFAGNTAPTKPLSGQIWFDSNTQKLKFYDGSQWKPTGGAVISGTAPVGGSEADFWWDNDNEQFYIRNSDNEWILIGPQAAGSGLTQLKSLTLTDTLAINHPVIAAYVNDQVIYIISATEFVNSSATAVAGFSRIKKGLTLINTDDTGVTSTDHYYWGTASNAAKLNGQPASYYDIDANFAARTSAIAFKDPGFTFGNDVDLTIKIDTDTTTPMLKLHQNNLRFRSSTDTLLYSLNNTGFIPGANNTYDIGTVALRWATVYATSFNGVATQADSLKVGSSYFTTSIPSVASTIPARDSNGDLFAREFNGTATKAKYADLAEKYTTPEDLPVGTAVAVCSCSDHEVEPANASQMCIGVVSAEPAVMMNSEAEGQYIGLKGRVPVRIKGPVKKGEPVYAWHDGVCTTVATTGLVGIALETKDTDEEALVECVLKV